MNKQVLIQIIKEFWIQTVLSLIWASYNLYISPNEDGLQVFIKNFTASIFLLSWLFGQVIRIKKQKKVEDNFESLLLKTENVITKQNESLKETVSNLTGGDSFCYLVISSINEKTNIGNYAFVSKGKYPLYDVTVRIHDCEKKIIPTRIEDMYKNAFELGNYSPESARMINQPIQLDKTKGLRWNCFFHARNGQTTQLIKMVYHNEKWMRATIVRRGGEILFEEIDKEFPIIDKELIFKD